MKRARPKHKYEFIYPTQPVELLKVWHYRWEFLRRNPQYKQDYGRFIQQFGNWFRHRAFWYETKLRIRTWSEEDEDYFYKKISPVIAKLCVKWRVGDLFPPERQFDLEGASTPRDKRTLCPPTSIAPELNWDFNTIQTMMERGFTGTGDSAERYLNHLRVEFDLDWPIKDLVDYARRALTYAQKNYHSELRVRRLPLPSTRRRFDQYDSYLKIWDLAQLGRTVPEIAALAFPSENISSARQKVRDHLKMARRLILGHSQEIR